MSILTVASWPAYRFLRRQVRWSGIPISFRIFQFAVIHTVKGFGIINKAEVDFFSGTLLFFRWSNGCWQFDLWFLCLFYIQLDIWKFTVHILLKPGFNNFEYYFTSMRDECNCVVVWAFFDIAFLRDWNEKGPFQSCGHCWIFQICWHTECSTFTASSFRIWNSSTGIPSPPLALFIVRLPKAH